MNHLHPRDRAARLLESCEQLIREAIVWNDLHPTERPLDCEEMRVAAAKARKFIEAWDRNDVAETKRLAKEISDYSRRFR